MSGKADYSIFKNISTAFMILLFHVVLIGIIGVLTLFLGWIGNNVGWIILGVSLLTSVAGYLFYRRMKSDGRAIKDIIGDASLKGKTVEVSFMGGMASFKIGDSQPGNIKQLEDPGSEKVISITELANLYEKELITSDEYDRAKEKILKR